MESWAWLAWVEVSYSRYGERGRVDLLAWLPHHGVLAVIEVKTEIVDVQAMLGTLDAKVRLGPFLAAELRLPRPSAVVPVLVVVDGSTNRDRVARLAPLFSRFDLRGRAATSWLRRPAAPPGGLLIFSDVRDVTGHSTTQGGSHRVRVGRSVPSVSRGR